MYAIEKEAASPLVASFDVWTVLISWMPATTPTCMVSCWAAEAMPKFDSSTALATEAAIDGVAMPEPSPDKASAHMIRASPEWVPTMANTSIDPTMVRLPVTADIRSPTRTATYPAMGAEIEKTSGRTPTSSPDLLSL